MNFEKLSALDAMAAYALGQRIAISFVGADPEIPGNSVLMRPGFDFVKHSRDLGERLAALNGLSGNVIWYLWK